MKLSSHPRFHGYPTRNLPQLKTLSPPFADSQRHHPPKERDARRAKAHGEAPPPFAMRGVGLYLGSSLYRAPTTFGNPATSLLERSMGFAPPPRGGFAFVASPERHSACELSY